MASVKGEPAEKAADSESAPVDVADRPAKGEAEKVEGGSLKELNQFADVNDKILGLVGLLCAWSGGLALPAFSFSFGELIDAFDPRNAVNFRDLITSVSTVLFVLAGGSFVAFWVMTTAYKITSERQSKLQRREHFRHVLRQDVSWFDGQEATELVAKLGDQARDIKKGLGFEIGKGHNMMSMFVFGIGFGFYFHWQLSLTIIILMPLMAIVGSLCMQFMTWSKSLSSKAYAKAGGVAEEHLRAIRTVQTFGGEEKAAAKYEQHALEAGRIGMRKGFISGIGSGLSNALIYIAYAVVFWAGGQMIRNNRNNMFEEYAALGCSVPEPYNVLEVCLPETLVNDTAGVCTAACTDDITPCILGDTCLSGGTVVIVFFSVIFGAFGLGGAMPAVGFVAGGKVAARQVTTLIQRKPPVDASSPDGAKLDDVKGSIVFKNVKFTYPTRPDAPVLQGLDLVCEAGKTTALCGASGCGKSTTIALLERFYDPNDGTVSLDGHDLKSLNLRWLRGQLGLVSQEPIVFADTIFNNIAFGHPDPSAVTREQVEEAAKGANAHDFIMDFPDGYDTFVGADGSTVSGGQKQRIAIARAIIRDPRVMLLDEATSALDNESEKVVQAALDSLLAAKRRTTIVIAHRLNTIRNSDKIVVFKEGTITEQGTHDELVALDGAYADLLRQQSGTDIDDVLDGTDSGAVFDVAEAKEEAENKEPLLVSGTAAGAAAGFAGDVDTIELSTSDSKQYAEVPDPMDDFKVNAGARRLLSLSFPDIMWIVSAVLSALINGAVMPAFAVVYAEVTAAFFEPVVEDLKTESQWWSYVFLILAAIALVSFTLQFWGFEVSGENLVARVRTMAFRNVVHFEMQFFDRKKNTAGAVGTRLADEAALVRGIAGERLGLFAQNFVTIGAGVGVAFAASWKLTLVVIGTLPIVMFASTLEMMSLAGDANQDVGRTDLETAGHVVSEAVHGIRTVQAFGLEDRLADVYGRRLEAPYQVMKRKAWLGGIGYGFSQGAQYLVFAIIFLIGGRWAERGELDINDLMRVVMGLMFSAMGAGQASALMPDANKAKAAAIELFRMVDYVPDINSTTEDGATLDTVRGDISFTDVQFTYPTRANSKVLRGLSLNIKAGQTVAFVGRSGCGKSTVMSLLLQFYRPQGGTITLDGQPLDSFNVKWLRSQFGVVSQEPTLIGEAGSTGSTIRDAIAYGAKPGAPVLEEAVVEAARAANAMEFISGFPDGLDTVIGAGGASLSGGQKQRIAIARAILRDPSILMLDEATSALDTESERVVQKALDALVTAKKRTTLVIAHRLSTIKNADMIVVVDDGRVAESGTHDELLAHDSLYAAQWTRGGGVTAE